MSHMIKLFSNDGTSKLVVAKNLHLPPPTLLLVPVSMIIGFDFVVESEEEISFMPLPIPTVINHNGRFETLPKPGYWKPELDALQCSHIVCTCLSAETFESDTQKATTVINHIHANRAAQSRKTVAETFMTRPKVVEDISSAYGIDTPTKHISSLLLANGYSDRHINRLGSKKYIWDQFAASYQGVLKYDKIIDVFDKGGVKSDAVKDRIFELMDKHEGELEKVWTLINDGIAKLERENSAHQV